LTLAIILRAQDAAIICQEKAVLQLGCYAVHYKHVCAVLKADKLLTRLTITVDAQNISLLFLNNGVLTYCSCSIDGKTTLNMLHIINTYMHI
jgi:hypothetical protein